MSQPTHGPESGRSLTISLFSPEDQARFWSKVERGDGCWLWMDARRPKGYGVFSVPVEGQRAWLQLRANRVAFVLVNGPLGPRELVRHTCDNPPCCRPDHLVKGDPTANKKDAVERNRVALGERHGRAVLTSKDVSMIRLRHASGETLKALACELGVDRSVVGDACCGDTWKCLTDPPPHNHGKDK